MPRLVTILPIYCTGEAVTYTCLSLAAHERPFGTPTTVWVPAAVGDGMRTFVRTTVPYAAQSLVYRVLGEPTVMRLFERRVLAALRPRDVVHLWPGMPISFVRTLASRGHPIVAERINCTRAYSKRVLDAEFERLGWPIEDGISEASIALENEELALADRVFAPNVNVRASLELVGIPPSRIIDTSYGYDPTRLDGDGKVAPPFDGLTIAFVGLACVRKGVHLLLEALERVKAPVRLLLAGRISPSIATRCAKALAQPNVIALGHVSNVGDVYRTADVFVFPSLEEGGPMVTYEAMGAGCAVVVSAMGAGAIVRDGIDGFVRSPHDVAAFADAIETLAVDQALRARMRAAARERAASFTWQKVAAKRQRAIETAFGSSP